MTLMQTIEANWQIAAVVAVIALVLLVWLLGRLLARSKSAPRERRPDVLDEGAAPAQRNQALIDAPPAAAVAAPPIVPPAVGGTFAGVAEVIAHGAQQEAQAAKAEPDPSTPPPTPAEVVAQAATVPPADPLADAATSAAMGQGDDLRRIKGLGPKLVATLHALGITRFAQIAAWTDADLDELDTRLGAFAGRPRRDAWVEQAQLLSGGDTAAYEARFGKL